MITITLSINPTHSIKFFYVYQYQSCVALNYQAITIRNQRNEPKKSDKIRFVAIK